MREEYSYNIILLGGTGAKCGEILLHMCANGYFKYGSLNMLYIDSDKQNGNAKKFKELHDTYVQCRSRYHIKGSPIDCFFHPEVRLFTADPVGSFQQFSDMIDSAENSRNEAAEGTGSNRNEAAEGTESSRNEAAEDAENSEYEVAEGARALMEVLYSEEEMKLQISNGFFAHPNVGAAVFAANMDQIMAELLNQIRVEMQEAKKIKIFLLGSIFGGTGAASLPTITRYLKETLLGASDNKYIQDQLKIGGCMVLPYFLFKHDNVTASGHDSEPVIEANKFAMKTRSALEYYKYVDEEDGRKTFDELFILGHDPLCERGYYAVAGENQRNLPHVVELYAATSAVTFFENGMEQSGHYFAVVPADKICGDNIYGGERGYGFFFVMMRFAIVMKSLILEELFDYQQKDKLRRTAKRIPWYYDFLNGKEKAKDFDTGRLIDYFKDISGFCDEYIRWFAELNLENIEKQDTLEMLDYGEDRGDIASYLNLFTKEIIMKQHLNNQIRNGNVKMDEDKRKNVYIENLQYIRKNLQNLENIHFNTDSQSEEIDMDRIWTRLCDMGFNSFLKDDEVFQNIVKSQDKTMESGVRNLVNAVFCACLF